MECPPTAQLCRWLGYQPVHNSLASVLGEHREALQHLSIPFIADSHTSKPKTVCQYTFTLCNFHPTIAGALAGLLLKHGISCTIVEATESLDVSVPKDDNNNVCLTYIDETPHYAQVALPAPESIHVAVPSKLHDAKEPSSSPKLCIPSLHLACLASELEVMFQEQFIGSVAIIAHSEEGCNQANELSARARAMLICSCAAATLFSIPARVGFVCQVGGKDTQRNVLSSLHTAENKTILIEAEAAASLFDSGFPLLHTLSSNVTHYLVWAPEHIHVPKLATICATLQAIHPSALHFAMQSIGPATNYCTQFLPLAELLPLQQGPKQPSSPTKPQVDNVPTTKAGSASTSIALLVHNAAVACLPQGTTVCDTIPFARMGFDSKRLVELASRLTANGLPCSPIDLFSYPTVDRLAQFFSGSKHSTPSAARLSKGQPHNAIINVLGLSCAAPGANSTLALWELLSSQRDPITTQPTSRLFPSFPSNTFAGLSDATGWFDNTRFDMSEGEARALDPQQRLVYHLVHLALDDAGIPPSELTSLRVGVFLGLSTTDNIKLNARASRSRPYDTTGESHATASGRIAFHFNFRGPCLTIDTACSSSLVAMHTAAASLRKGEIDVAVVAGANCILSSDTTEAYQALGMLSPTGRCHTLDASADGYVRSEGGAAVVLATNQAFTATHAVPYALLQGSAINQDGTTTTLTAPSALAQQQVIVDALANAQLTADRIDMIEMHGTGTRLGDPIEMHAIEKVFLASEVRLQKPLVLGAAKASVGHLEAAAGILGFVKAVACLSTQTVSGNLHFHKLNPLIPNLSTFQFPTTTKAHPLSHIGVSSFGFSGTNSHVILQSCDTARKLPSASVKFGSFFNWVSDSTVFQGTTLRATSTKSETSFPDPLSSLSLKSSHVTQLLLWVDPADDIGPDVAEAWLEQEPDDASILLLCEDDERLKHLSPSFQRLRTRFHSSRVNVTTQIPQTLSQYTLLVSGECFLEAKVKLHTAPLRTIVYCNPVQAAKLMQYMGNTPTSQTSMLQMPLELTPLRKLQATRLLVKLASCTEEAMSVALLVSNPSHVQQHQGTPTITSTSVKGVSDEEMAETVNTIATAVYNVLGDTVASDEPLMDAGVDSIVTAELIASLEEVFGLSLPATLTFDYPTISDIARHLLQSQRTSAEAVLYNSNSPAASNQPLHRGDIAITGMACRFPGGSRSAPHYWHTIQTGVDAIGRIPYERFDINTVFSANPEDQGKMYVRESSFLEDVDFFDARFFGISPVEAAQTDPQQRLLLETCYSALFDAGFTKQSLHGKRVAVIVGSSSMDWDVLQFGVDNAFSGTGAGRALMANRISYTLGLTGPSISVDTACSASLVAIHLAEQALNLGECDVAVAGGVNLLLTPDMFLATSKARMLSPDCRCKTFDASANGYVRGEGCGAVVLQRAKDCSSDKVHAILKGSATNQDGRSASLTAPNGPAQQDVIKTALARARLSGADIDYVEAHGTGTALGDPIEVGALKAVLGPNRTQDRPLVLGAVKTQIGHTEGAAGVAGLIKAILCLQHGRVPGNLHLQELNPKLDLSDFPVTFPSVDGNVDLAARVDEEGYLYAGVSSFGFGGANAHCVIAGGPNVTRRACHVYEYERQWFRTFANPHPLYGSLDVPQGDKSTMKATWDAHTVEYLSNHRVGQRTVVAPASIMILSILEHLRRLGRENTLLKDVQLHTMLQLHDDAGPIHVATDVDGDRASFFSVSRDNERVVHASCLLDNRTVESQKTTGPLPYSDILTTVSQDADIDHESMYTRIGNKYRGDFKSAHCLWWLDDDSCISEVELLPNEACHPDLIAPALLDACFHGAILLAQGRHSNDPSAYLMTKLDSISLNVGCLNKHSSLLVVHTKQADGFSVEAYTKRGQLVLAGAGLDSQASHLVERIKVMKLTRVLAPMVAHNGQHLAPIQGWTAVNLLPSKGRAQEAEGGLLWHAVCNIPGVLHSNGIGDDFIAKAKRLILIINTASPEILEIIRQRITDIPDSDIVFVANAQAGALLSALGSFLRTVQLEVPELSWCIVSVNEPMQDLAERIGHVLGMASRPQEVILSKEQTSSLVLNEMITTLPRTFEASELGHCVVSGGLGGLGLLTAEWLLERGCKHVTLLSRSGSVENLSAARWEWLVSKYAQQISVLKCDVVHPAQVATAMQRVLLGSDDIVTVIHSAGVLCDGLCVNQSQHDVLRAMEPKSLGLWNIHHALMAGGKATQMLAFSSIAAVLGSPAQTAYAYANGAMDSWIQDLHAMGFHYGTVQWGAWADIGMAARSGTNERLSVQGFKSIDTETGKDALELAFQSLASGAHFAICPMNWAQFFSKTAASQTQLSVLQQQTNSKLQSPSPGEGNVSEVQSKLYSAVCERILALDRSKQVEAVQDVLMATLDEVLGFQPEINEGLMEAGLDSLATVEFRNSLQSLFGGAVKVSSTAVFDFPTVHTLALHIHQQLAELPLAHTSSSLSREVTSGALATLATQAVVGVSDNAIVVTGLACRFPGHSNTIDEFWNMMVSGKDCVASVPSERFSLDAFFSEDNTQQGKMYVREAAFMDGVDLFDASFFGISPAEAAQMDPQQRILLEVCYSALEDAGYTKETLLNKRVGIFVGMMNVDMTVAVEKATSFTGTSLSRSIHANRISYLLGVNGPSMTVDTACSSSLVSVHLAAQALQSGDCDIAVAAGVNLMLDPFMFVAECRARMLSPDCRCHTFDAGANGYVRGEGCGAVVLTTSLQQQQTDAAYCTLAGSATNQDGRSASLTAPNGPSQQSVMQASLARAGVEGSDVCFVETHGTGTALGDPIEVGAVKAVMGKGRSSDSPLVLGALKTQIGHTEGAAGIAGFIKTVLCLYHQKVPGNLHLATLNPKLDLEGFPVLFPARKEGASLISKDGQDSLVAGVSSFGFGGTNAHCTLMRSAKQHRRKLSQEHQQKATYQRTWFSTFAPMPNSMENTGYQVVMRPLEHPNMRSAREIGADTQWAVICPTSTLHDGFGHSQALSSVLAILLSDAEYSIHKSVAALESGEPSHVLLLTALAGDLDIAHGVFFETQDQLAKLHAWHPAAQVVLVTCGATATMATVLPGTANTLSLFQGGMALARSARMEFPTMRLKTVDIATIASLALLNLHAVLSTDEDDFALNTDLTLTSPRLVAAPTPIAGTSRLPWNPLQQAPKMAHAATNDMGAFIITGGLGGIGLAVAEWIARTTVGAKIVLVTRSGRISEELLDAFSALRCNAEHRLAVAACDVQDEAESKALFTYVNREFGDIHAVFHAAGVASGGGIGTISEQDVGTAFGPKVLGTWNLHTAALSCCRGPLVLYSSVSVVLGFRSGAAYAAANESMDMLCSMLQGVGLPSTSVRWGSWTAQGMFARYMKQDEVAAERRLKYSAGGISQQLGLDWHEAALSSPDVYACTSVMRVDWSEFLNQYKTIPSLLKELQPMARKDNAMGLQPASIITVESEFMQELRTLSREEQVQRIQDAISDVVGGLVGDDVDIDAPFMDAGIDSIAMVELQSSVQNILGETVQIDDDTLFNYPTVRRLSLNLSDSFITDLDTSTTSLPVINASHLELNSDLKGEIGVVGMACQFPGGIDSVPQLWAALMAGRCTIDDVPHTRWNRNEFFDSRLEAPGKMYTTKGGFLPSIETFDAKHFGITPAEAARMDPQQRLVLETVECALLNAGIGKEQRQHHTVGTFIGATDCGWASMLNEAGDTSAYYATGSSASIIANRVSYTLGLEGPSMTIDTACSSSLSAFHVAVNSLKNGDCDVAVVGGVNLLLTPQSYIATCKARMLSVDGKCKTFSKDANGYVRSEGCGAIVLRMIDDDEEKARCLALVSGSAVNQDGRSAGLTAPNGVAQEKCYSQALNGAGIEPNEVTFVETHGTGTALGDPIEFNGLMRVYCDEPREHPLVLGAVKSNIGHLEVAAGMPALIKAVLCLNEETMPTNLWCDELNPKLQTTDEAVIPRGTMTHLYPTSYRGLVGGVSSFGFGGTNAHVLLSQTGVRRTSCSHGCSESEATPSSFFESKEHFALPDVPWRQKSAQDTSDHDQTPTKTKPSPVPTLTTRRQAGHATHSNLMALVVRFLEENLGIEDVDQNVSMVDLGLDSLCAAELETMLNQNGFLLDGRIGVSLLTVSDIVANSSVAIADFEERGRISPELLASKESKDASVSPLHCSPALDTLSEPQRQAVFPLHITHKEHGSVQFLEPVNMSGVELERDIVFSHGCVDLQGMLRMSVEAQRTPVIVTLNDIRCPSHLDPREFSEALRNVQGCQFLHYNKMQGSWTFTISTSAA
eukprot:m.319927 g.319927  ORF g.319927 m.319927 type:complete len:4290 (+) comp15991_c1_seq6:393-13262(+)